jgi:hypothetical protein
MSSAGVELTVREPPNRGEKWTLSARSLVDIGVVGIIGEPRRDRCGPRQIGSGWLSISARTAHHCDGRVLGASQACGVTWCS